ncbi:hypothetical protein THAOC_31759 [Thalassiosira oceanica]|uniref:Uncharacterized protein n=1 Tax=Thalassiosira oceanica TaxID=159749 RepID=K0RKD0_THAOC|nr:hypothetical protein THAOC_31759 [Thalassiosira oceanica]|eukprot:EJK49371.1 hypothetical protein THAOC_31759 [Thalassiosira oceanica]
MLCVDAVARNLDRKWRHKDLARHKELARHKDFDTSTAGGAEGDRGPQVWLSQIASRNNSTRRLSLHRILQTSIKMKIFVALALVTGAAYSSATLPKVGSSVEVDCFQQCAQVALEGHNQKNCKQDCVVQYCDVPYDDDDDDDDDDNGRRRGRRGSRRGRRGSRGRKGRRGRRSDDDDDDDDDFDACKDECRVCCSGGGDAQDRIANCRTGQRREGRTRNDDDGYVDCKQDCIADECTNPDGSNVAEYGPCVRDCKDDCDAEEAKFEAEKAESLFANGGAESKECLDKCIAAQMA